MNKNEKMGCYCPECGHEFVQGEYNYNYDSGCLDFECPECDWQGTDLMVDHDDEDDEEEDY